MQKRQNEEFLEQRREYMKRSSRGVTHFRYSPSDDMRAAVAALGRLDEAGFKTIKLRVLYLDDVGARSNRRR